MWMSETTTKRSTTKSVWCETVNDNVKDMNEWWNETRLCIRRLSKMITFETISNHDTISISHHQYISAIWSVHYIVGLYSIGFIWVFTPFTTSLLIIPFCHLYSLVLSYKYSPLIAKHQSKKRKGEKQNVMWGMGVGRTRVLGSGWMDDGMMVIANGMDRTPMWWRYETRLTKGLKWTVLCSFRW